MIKFIFNLLKILFLQFHSSATLIFDKNAPLPKTEVISMLKTDGFKILVNRTTVDVSFVPFPFHPFKYEISKKYKKNYTINLF